MAAKSKNGTGQELREATAQLRLAGVDTAELDARLLLQHVLNTSHAQLLTREVPLSQTQSEHFSALIARRIAREPVGKILGQRAFWKHDFIVTRDVLEPRPDSETLIEESLKRFADHDRPLRILDLGTGSGCLLLTMLAEYPQSWGVGVDYSAAALQVARRNAIALGLNSRVSFLQSDWASALGVNASKGNRLDAGFDLILCNPPYIPEGAIPFLAPEVKDYDPHRALSGGKDGLHPYRILANEWQRLLAPQGFAVMELGFGQHEAVSAIMQGAGLIVDGTGKDLANVERALIVKRNA